jgi:glycosyltransferase involved in cell wall biosynthesis
MVRIAIVYATDFIKISPGGIQNYLRRLLDAAPTGAGITVFGVGTPPPDFRFDFISVLNPDDVDGKVNWAFAKALSKIDFSGFDIVIFQRADNQLFVRKKRNQSFIIFLHGGTLNAWRARKDLFSLAYAVIELIAIRKSDRVYSVSVHGTWKYFVYRHKVMSAPRVFDSEIYNMNRISSDRQAFALVGRLSREKRFELGIKALSDSCEQEQLPARLIIVGAGEEEARLRSMPKSDFLSVEFLGQKSPNEVAVLLKSQVKIILVTSLFEGFPLVALEAAACGVEVFGIKAPGVSESLAELGYQPFEDLKSFQLALRTAVQGLSVSQHLDPPKDESNLFWAALNLQ